MKTRRQTIKTLISATAFCNCGVSDLFGQQELKAEGQCNYYGEEFGDTIYTYSSNSEAVDVVTDILKHTGLNQNFEIHAANVPNAMAAIRGDRRYILYNQEFMRGVKHATKTDWAGTSILAHEIGHHLQGHTIQAGGSRPVIELEADKYSGFVLQRMGATIDEAKIAMQKIGSDSGSPTHPKKRDRLVAIVAGWNQAKELEGIKKSDIEEEPNKQPQEQITIPEKPEGTNFPPSSPREQSVRIQPIARCVFQGDQAAYIVMSDNSIIGFNSFGQAIPVGRRIPPTMQGFAWMYQTQYTTYGVDGGGRIWTHNAIGQLMQIGYVTNT